MKKITICLLFVMVASQFSCKKFLQITPYDKLTGNNFYQSESDIESNITDMYGQLFDKYVQTNTAGATGEFRSGEVIPAASGNTNRPTRYDVGLLGGHTRRIANSGTTSGFQTIPTTVVNDRLLLNAMASVDPSSNTVNVGRFYNLQYWAEYYRVIQQANILVAKVSEGIPALSAEQSKAYIAEAKFIRNYCFFFMTRLYGDIVYYTEPYQKDPLPRENMVSVVNKCIADLKTAKNDLPASVLNPALRGVRASKGAVIGLLMNMNMWNAGFDPANKTKYFQETKALGAELRSLNAFRLLNLSEWNTVSKGRSEESLFELFSTVNYNQSSNAFFQVFTLAAFGEAFIHFPYRLPEYDFRTSPCVFTADYMRKLFPDEQDDRLTVWFDEPFNQNAETFQLKKFAGNTFIEVGGSQSGIPDNTFLIMRYADALLLEAEACAELGGADETNAIARLNDVRNRARVAVYPSATDVTGQKGLKDAIFWERAKELMGEGSHYFDLIRTKKILSRSYTDNPLTVDKFDRGAWTWPIAETALSNNPYMSLNGYWRGSGL